LYLNRARDEGDILDSPLDFAGWGG